MRAPTMKFDNDISKKLSIKSLSSGSITKPSSSSSDASKFENVESPVYYSFRKNIPGQHIALTDSVARY